jgi:uncharacterized protein (TIGR03083 family)
LPRHMTLADQTIAALRATHDELAATVTPLSPAQLAGPSGASEWSIAQVLSHLGSGAEITLASLRVGLGNEPAPGDTFNQSVWDRWNALSEQDQATGSLQADALLVEALEELTPEQRADLQIEVGFLPFPLSVASFAAMRLNEATLHSWDVRIALEPQAVLSDESATLLAEHFAGELGFLLGFLGKAEVLTNGAVVDFTGSDFGLTITESVAASSTVSAPTATFSGPTESVIRLISGRLTPAHTPESVAVTGDVTLDDLRRVFPGF